MRCLCRIRPIPVYDEYAGETVCDACGTVLEEKAARAVWDGAAMSGSTCTRHVTKYVTAQRMADGSADVARNALLHTLAPILEHILASGIITDEAVTLVRRMSADGFARGRPRLNLCAGAVLAACRVHGRTITRQEIASVSGTDFRRVSRAARMIIEQYALEPLSVEERTRRILSRMCNEIGEPGLLRPALLTYESMLLAGHTFGKRPYVVAAKALRAHTVRIMSDARFAVAVGVPQRSMSRYVEMTQNAC